MSDVKRYLSLVECLKVTLWMLKNMNKPMGANNVRDAIKAIEELQQENARLKMEMEISDSIANTAVSFLKGTQRIYLRRSLGLPQPPTSED